MVKSGDDTEHARRDFYRDCPVKPDNDKNARLTIFIEILGSSPRMTQSGQDGQ